MEGSHGRGEGRGGDREGEGRGMEENPNTIPETRGRRPLNPAPTPPVVQFLDASSWTNARIPTVEAMRLNDTAPRPRHVGVPCSFLPGAVSRLRHEHERVLHPGPSFLADTGKTVDRFSVHREYSILRFHALRTWKKKKFCFSEFLIFRIGKEVEKLKYLFVSFFLIKVRRYIRYQIFPRALKQDLLR